MDPDNLPEGDVKTMNFAVRRRQQGQGLERHLGLRPGHWRGDLAQPLCWPPQWSWADALE
jgi:hypothetical protein